MNYINPYNLPETAEEPALKGLNDSERVAVAILRVVVYIISFVIAIVCAVVMCAIFSGCTTPRTVEEHHHHYYEADTMAVRAQVDRHLSSWHEESEAWLHQAFSEQSASWFSHEDQKEIVTELITVTTDSLGREIRTEQRTISRDIARDLQQQEQRITREYEQRLRVAVDSVGSIYQQRFDSLAAHVAQSDSTSSISHPTSVIEHRPWYRRLWDRLNEVFIIALIATVLWFTRKLWWPVLRRLMSRRA